MDYLLENLGPERFQEVCHALLAKAYPSTQCFPVGQRDGGRDAISLLYEEVSDDFIVYQVKFVRNPLAESEPHRWLADILKAEAPKVMELVPKGAKRYVIMTNVPGTAFPESGSIDTVQRILSEHIPILGQCWWRDDVNRRLDDAWNIKWAYPEILSGPDILRSIIEHGLTDDIGRRIAAMRAFVRDQFERDTEVKFKQVELQNKLLDLFVDVPVSLREGPLKRSEQASLYAILTIAHREHQHGDNVAYSPEAGRPGAVSLLLHPVAQQNLTRVVIEGAPGQGKSTISQYICQIHRSRILSKQMDDPRIPEPHRTNPVRLPFKIDCRDLALWLNRKNPFSADDQADVPTTWQKSLESFLAHQITYHSGGSLFSVADLHAIARVTAVLLVFDGLDEVADISLRREVVNEIQMGTTRIGEVSVSLQVIVTSRPAAFANSPGLPEETFTYIQLDSITRPLIEQYAEKWLRARRLDGREASDVRKILRDKLDQPHLRELARNPMQLAILLTLIQTRGRSLPDKRTSLYDSYVELFFNREAEKSSIVREHRDLLIDIHRYLAWILHSEAQTKRNRGSVNAERLRQLVDTYLKEEGHDPSWAQQLFTGMVERVVALVSRVQGTYEFEVQPLREYFAARHLYNTAPYSPPGHERKGTLPDRFDALARDFFWQNVTRFYAGCYSKGELPSLVERLEELARSVGYRHTSHPQSLAATLLSDWVFAQHPKSTKQVVALILHGVGLRQVTSGGRRYKRDEPLALPRQSGGVELVDRCFEILRGFPPRDYALMLSELIRANASAADAKARWLLEIEPTSHSKRTAWVEVGLYLGALGNLSDSELEAVVGAEEAPERLSLVLRSGQSIFVESDRARFEAVLGHWLEGSQAFNFRKADSVLEAFGHALAPQRYARAFRGRQPVALSRVRDLYASVDSPELPQVGPHALEWEEAEKCREFIQRSRKVSERLARDWATQIEPWSDLVECGRSLFGDRWAFCVLASVSAGVRSKDETCEDAAELYEQGTSLCRRARYARLRAGSASWWRSRLDAAKDESHVAFALLLFWSWAGPTVLERLLEVADEKTRGLSPAWWRRLSGGMQVAGASLMQERPEVALNVASLPAGISEKAVVAVASRLGSAQARELVLRFLTDYEGDDPWVLELCQKAALLEAQQKPQTWRRWLPMISRSYTKGAIGDRFFPYRFARAAESEDFPIEIAEKIVEECDRYPTELAGWAERICRQHVAEAVVPVGEVARRDAWFV